MHEWALAEATISAILKAVEERGAKKVTEVKVKIGKLQQVELEVLDFALKELAKRTPLKGTKFKLEWEEARFRCKACGLRWGLSDVGTLSKEELEAVHFVPELIHAFARCPRCKSPDFEIVGGRGIWLEYVKISR